MNRQLVQSAQQELPIYMSSTPLDESWGQLPASYYTLNVVNGIMYGRLIDGVYQASLSTGSRRYDETMRLEVASSLNKSIKDNAEVWAELAKS